MKQKAAIVLSFMFVLAIYSCTKDDNTNKDDVYSISASMSAANEVGANTSAGNTNTYPGTGSVTGSYNATTNQLQYNVTWSGLSGAATAGHFHGPALAGTSAGVQVPFTIVNSGTSGTAAGTASLTDTQETDLLAGKWYANIHTQANGGGEIRGQVSAVK